MRINADFSRCVTVTPDQHQWVPSPQSGVERVMLDRVGAERARATSLVRYAPESVFPAHHHPGGEEVLVLSGTFTEGGQDHPAGGYLRSPPGSSHQPSSAQGAVIFVKLWQMPPTETRPVRLDTRDPANWRHRGDRAVCELFASDGEQVSLQRLPPGQRLCACGAESGELLVLDGGLWADGTPWPVGTWSRWPAGAQPDPVAGEHGCTVYLKTGHLADPAHLGAWSAPLDLDRPPHPAPCAARVKA